MFQDHIKNSHAKGGGFPAILGKILCGVFFVGLMALILGLIIMLLWNAIMPNLFYLPAISFWQAVGLFLLARILVGGFGVKHKHHPAHTRHSPHTWHDYERWWNEVGEKSFREYSSEKANDEEKD